jgi:hypothetical protein
MEDSWIRFLQFLHKEGVYKEFRENLYFSAFMRDENIYDRVEHLKRSGNYISSAFVWGTTSQGHHFWRIINEKWEKIELLMK